MKPPVSKGKEAAVKGDKASLKERIILLALLTWTIMNLYELLVAP